MAANKSSRRRAREFLVQGLYQAQVAGQDAAAIQIQAEGVTGFDRIDRELYDALLAESLAHMAALQEDIAPHLDRAWNEVSPIERSILLLGACELKLHIETPYRVIINEGIELAKTFGGTDGHKFVNGVLDKLAAVMRPNEVKT
jgi:N utilization substance protein B